MEEISATIPEYQPLRVLWHSFVQPRPTNHPFLPRFAHYSRISTFIYCRISNPKFIEIGSTSLLIIIQPYKVLLSVKNFLHSSVFFLYFQCTLYEGLHESQDFNFQIFILCITNNSLIPSTKLAPAFLLCILHKLRVKQIH